VGTVAVTLLVIWGCGFVFAAISHGRLRSHVSREKLLEVEDLRKLWRYCPPPRSVLTTKGQRLHSYFWIGLIVSFVSIVSIGIVLRIMVMRNV
jgi:hypothetical protein